MLRIKKYTSKSKAIINSNLNNHRKDVNKQNLLQADQYFQLPIYNFNKHAKLK